MKKCLSIFLVLILIIGILPMTANASETPNFRFELTVDGGETKEVQTGDIITVVLRLKRTDSAESYGIIGTTAIFAQLISVATTSAALYKYRKSK